MAVSDLVTDLTTHLTAASATRATGSQIRRDLDAVAAATTNYQLRVSAQGILRAGSNTEDIFDVVGVQLTLYRGVSSGADEITKLESTLFDVLQPLMTASTWRAFASVDRITEEPSVSLERIQDALIYEFQIGLTLAS